MKVAGIDFSTNAVDIVFVDLDDKWLLEWYRFTLVGQDAFDRTRMVGESMHGRSSVWWEDIYAVGIEHPAGKFGTGAMLRVQGAVLSMIPGELMVKPWPPGAWRKAVGLSGSASKQDVAAWSYSNGANAQWPQDAHDAYAIAFATRLALRKETPVPVSV